MRSLFLIVLLAAAETALSAVLEVRRTSGCVANNCARAVTGTRSGKIPDVTSRMADCSSFMATTILPSTTIAPTQVPAYASACSDPGSFSSACSCWGILPTTTRPIVTYTGIIEVFSGATSRGYIAPDPNYWTPLLTPNAANALSVSFQLPQGATSGSRLNLYQLNDSRGPLLGLVQGRDSTSADIRPGSFNYLYLDPVAAPGTAPGATPQNVPSYFSTTAGSTFLAETAVWSVDLTTGAISCQWINNDGSDPVTVEFTQSNHVYAGGDASAFNARFPSPVAAVTFRFISA